MRVDTGTVWTARTAITSTNLVRLVSYNSMEKCPGGRTFLIATVDI